MKSILAGKTILVTGGTGSIGSEIVRQALGQEVARVIIFSRDEIKHFLIRKRIVDNRLQTVVGDVRNLRSLAQVFDRFNVDIVYHAAAMKHVVMCEDFPIETVETNILGTQNVVDLALKNGVSQTITISTDKAACSMNVMGATKFIGERITLNANKICRENQTFACVRFGNVLGSRGSVIPVYIDNLRNAKPLQVTDPNVTRFMMQIPDAVRLIIQATEQARGGEVFILKMKSFKLADLVEVMLKRVAPRLNVDVKNIKLEMTGLVSGEKLHEKLINEEESGRLYEKDNIYIVLPNESAAERYPGVRKADLVSYSSTDVELLSQDEIEQMVNNYLATNPAY